MKSENRRTSAWQYSKDSLKQLLIRWFPNQIYAYRYWKHYHRATSQLGNQIEKREQLFAEMLARSKMKPSLSMQVGVRGEKYAPHFISVDLYDKSPIVDYNYDIQDLPFKEESFAFVVCNAVLEHVPYPQKAISEFWRILQPGGEIWIEVPFNQPYHPSPNDYWRVTPNGMSLWMAEFHELEKGLFSPYHSSTYNAIFYHGKKPESG